MKNDIDCKWIDKGQVAILTLLHREARYIFATISSHCKGIFKLQSVKDKVVWALRRCYIHLQMMLPMLLPFWQASHSSLHWNLLLLNGGDHNMNVKIFSCFSFKPLFSQSTVKLSFALNYFHCSIEKQSKIFW